MELSGLHILLTYQCTKQCRHCFVWGGPFQEGVFSLNKLHDVLQQAHAIENLEWIFFEGGEPFLYYPVLVRGVQIATAMGFQVGVVSNAFWATTLADAELWLKPLADLIGNLTLSDDNYHRDSKAGQNVENAIQAARTLNIPVDLIRVIPTSEYNALVSRGEHVDDCFPLMYRGRAATNLVPGVETVSWQELTTCPHEDLRNPGRCHLDPFGNVHICQGVVIGNVFERSLQEILTNFDPDTHPVCGALLRGGPAGLVKENDLEHLDRYVDACHLCYSARKQLRQTYPEFLTPDQMYGNQPV